MYFFFSKPRRGDIIIKLLDPYKIKPRRGEILFPQANILLAYKVKKMHPIYHSFGVLIMNIQHWFIIITPLRGWFIIIHFCFLVIPLELITHLTQNCHSERNGVE